MSWHPGQAALDALALCGLLSLSAAANETVSFCVSIPLAPLIWTSLNPLHTRVAQIAWSGVSPASQQLCDQACHLIHLGLNFFFDIIGIAEPATLRGKEVWLSLYHLSRESAVRTIREGETDFASQMVFTGNQMLEGHHLK